MTTRVQPTWPEHVTGLCSVHYTTAEKKWCASPSTFIVRPTCVCGWVLTACGKHVSSVLAMASCREDVHEGSATLAVVPVHSFRGRIAR